jgi:hypothetical protein
VSVLRLHIDTLQLPAGSVLDQDRLRAALAGSLASLAESPGTPGGQRPNLSALELAVVATVTTAVHDAAAGQPVTGIRGL